MDKNFKNDKKLKLENINERVMGSVIVDRKSIYVYFYLQMKYLFHGNIYFISFRLDLILVENEIIIYSNKKYI